MGGSKGPRSILTMTRHRYPPRFLRWDMLNALAAGGSFQSKTRIDGPVDVTCDADRKSPLFDCRCSVDWKLKLRGCLFWRLVRRLIPIKYSHRGAIRRPGPRRLLTVSPSEGATLLLAGFTSETGGQTPPHDPQDLVEFKNLSEPSARTAQIAR